MLMHLLYPHQSPWGERPFSGHVDPCTRSPNNKRGREKRVTWATEDRIRQVLLFVSDEELPVSQSLLLGRVDAPISLEVEQVLPPGFEVSSAKRLRLEHAQEALMPVGRLWETPQKFVPHSSWLVADGSKSLEVAAQQQREPRELEAVYPRVTSIPHSPAEPFENSHGCDEASIPEIPLLPVEDDEDCAEDDEPGNEIVNIHYATPGFLEPVCLGHGMKHLQGVADPDIAAAVAAALMVVKDPGVSNRVDEDLLIKLLKNPTLLQTLSSTNDKFVQGSGGSPTPKSQEDATTIDVTSSLPSICDRKTDVSLTSKKLFPDRQQVPEASSNVPLDMGVQPWMLVQHGVVANKQTIPWPERMSMSAVEQIAEYQSIVNCSQLSPCPPREWSANADLSSGPDTAGTGTKVFSYAQTKVAPPPSSTSIHQLTSLPTKKNPRVSGILDFHVPSSRTESLAQACRNLPASLSSHPRCLGHQEKQRGTLTPDYLANNNEDSIRNLDVRNHSLAASHVAQIAKGNRPKHCIFFNTPRGCRKGATCEFLHETDNPAKPCYHSTTLVL